MGTHLYRKTLGGDEFGEKRVTRRACVKRKKDVMTKVVDWGGFTTNLG